MVPFLTKSSATAYSSQPTEAFMDPFLTNLMPNPLRAAANRKMTLTIEACRHQRNIIESAMPPLTIDEIPELLARLADKSLIHSDANGRFNLLQLVRQFAQEELARTDDGIAVRRRHLAHYAGLCHKNVREMNGPNVIEGQDLYVKENENIRHAIEWALDNQDMWPMGAQCIRDTYWSHFNRGAMTEGIALCTHAIDNAPSDADTTILGGVWGMLCTYQQLSDHPDAIATCDKLIELAEKWQDAWPLAMAKFQKGQLLMRRGKSNEAQVLLADALELIRQVDNRGARGIEFAILNMLGSYAVMDERFEDAKSYYDGCLRICNELNMVRGYAVVYGNLGHLHERLGDYKAAHKAAISSAEMFLQLNDVRNLAGGVANTASGYWVAGDYENAVQALGFAYAIWAKTELVVDPIDGATAERWATRLKEKMGDDAFAAAFERGKSISPNDMLAKILSNPEPWTKIP